MGSVWRATDEAGRTAAVKMIRADLQQDAEAIRRFRQEFDVARRVTSRRVAIPLEASLERDPAYIAWEHVDGTSLQTTVDHSGPLAVADAVELARDLAEALRDLEAAGITHRDVKPANVVLGVAGAVLVDLGVALIDDQTGLTSRGLVMGTPSWLTPEQLDGDRPRAAADVFNWAGVVAFASAGRGPFGADTLPRMMYRVAHESPDLSQVPDALSALVSAALAKDPTARPTARELAGQLNALIDGRTLEEDSLRDKPTIATAAPTSSPRSSTAAMAAADVETSATVPPRPSRRFGRLAVAVAAAVATVAVAAYAALPDRPETDPVAASDADRTPKLERDSAAEPSAEPGSIPTVQEPVEATTEPAGPPRYLTTDGTEPTQRPSCSGLLGICLGNPIERATEQFGTEALRYDGINEGDVIRTWELDAASLSVTADDVGSLREIQVTAGTGTLFSTPLDGVTVGMTTMGELAAIVGDGAYPTVISGEGFTVVGLVAMAGPEGSEAWQGFLSVDRSEAAWEPLMDSRTDREAVLAAVGDRPITRFSVGYDFPEQEYMPAADLYEQDWGWYETPPLWVYDVLADPALNGRGVFQSADASLWTPDAPINVVISPFEGSATGRGMYAFFFARDRGYIGTDALEASEIISPAWRDDTTIAIGYALYREGDSGCCPTGGTEIVRFHWDGGQLIALDEIPPISGPTSR